jgi:hypothetical protein
MKINNAINTYSSSENCIPNHFETQCENSYEPGWLFVILPCCPIESSLCSQAVKNAVKSSPKEDGTLAQMNLYIFF